MKIRSITIKNNKCIIPLSQNKEAICDNKDYNLIKNYNWFANQIHNIFYARTNIKYKNGKKTVIFLHRHLLGLRNNKIQVDHIDGNGLNNCRSNIRTCSHAENLRNQKLSIKSTSGFKGVSWHKNRNKYIAQIKINSKHINLGYFRTKELAAKTYKMASKKLHKNFSNTSLN